MRLWIGQDTDKTVYFLAQCNNCTSFKSRTCDYILPCWSVGRSVGRSVTFLNSEQFAHYCSCPTVRNLIAMYPALLPLTPSGNIIYIV